MTEVLYTGPDGWGQKAYPGDAGIDLPIIRDQILMPGEFADMASGIRVAIPEGYYGRIVARSSALRKRRIRVYEGIIDSGFRGELFTYMEAIGPGPSEVKVGDRLAQLIIQPVLDIPVNRADILPESVRGTQGFGSSDYTNGHGAVVLVEDQDGPLISIGSTRITPRPMIYLGGPIDHAADLPWWQIDKYRSPVYDLTSEWEWYDPAARNKNESNPSVIWNRNMDALLTAEVALFAFIDGSGAYGFGSPIEIYERCTQPRRKPTIAYVEGHSPGVYLRKLWQDHGLILSDNWKDTVRLLGEEIARAV